MTADPRPIELRSDNSAGVAQPILDAIGAANNGSALAYGGDDVTTELTATVRRVFEHDEAAVFPVATGTAANALGLSAMCPPWGSVLCHETAHIIQNECGATSMFGGGVVMHGLGGTDFRIDPSVLAETLEATGWRDPHHSQPSVLSLTIPTDFGTLYSPDEVATLADTAEPYGLSVHVDGARIANALSRLGVTPAELTWRAGVDVLSLGATKNGVMSTDAIVCFDPAISEQLVYRTKRAGHVPSKLRYQSAQLRAYLADDLWLSLAGAANRAMEELSRGLAAMGFDFVNRPDVNILYIRVDERIVARMEAEHLLFYRIAPGLIRLVTSFQTTSSDVEEALARVARAAGRSSSAG